jgi:hypothetical protein
MPDYWTTPNSNSITAVDDGTTTVTY